MIEKFYKAINAVAITASGTINGKLTLATTLNFKVKMRVLLEDPVAPDIALEVKRVNSSNELELGPIGQSIQKRTDLSAYSATSTLRSILQKRPDIPLQEIERAVFEEEPTVALRVKPVDPFGNSYTVENPIPVQLSDGSINIGTVNAELEVQLSHQDNVPDAGDVADSVQVGDGTGIFTGTELGSSKRSLDITPFGLSVSSGDIPGINFVNKFGHNPRVERAIEEDIHTGGGDYNFLTSPTTLTVVSDSANDDDGGTGTNTIKIEGLDSDWNEVSEDLIMDGLFGVTTANLYIRINRSYALVSGSIGTNDGLITIKNGATLISQIEAGDGQTFQSVYTVPNGKTGFLDRMYYGVHHTTDSVGTRTADIYMIKREPGGSFRRIQLVVAQSEAGTQSLTWERPEKLLAKTDVKMRVESYSNHTDVLGGFHIILEDN